ncbi:hypothetical protein DEO72_LG5g1823 [Vigna unguiculata]|uniref:Uncharacterized protein n=1 Tax=Vigna unguiculata TaxID=3917 RepID=A0A4D6M0L5_VIGUN|nr:hypothetical protein DEO72_LG5g1822 [Vigna unguiculata]QCD93747.1 hypothetical protein DEO72_LG5g1823 [Vigna unguiculata]
MSATHQSRQPPQICHRQPPASIFSDSLCHHLHVAKEAGNHRSARPSSPHLASSLNLHAVHCSGNLSHHERTNTAAARLYTPCSHGHREFFFPQTTKQRNQVGDGEPEQPHRGSPHLHLRDQLSTASTCEFCNSRNTVSATISIAAANKNRASSTNVN